MVGLLGALEVVETVEPGPEGAKGGFEGGGRSGVPLAYMNLLAKRSGGTEVEPRMGVKGTGEETFCC